MTEPLDTSDLDALEELKLSTGYKLMRARVLEELERRRDELELDRGMEYTFFTRGYIKALRTILEVPDILAAEIAQTIAAEG